MRDMHSVVAPAILIANATLSADNTPISVDLATYDGCMILLHIGVGGITFTGTNKIEFILRHGDDADQTTHQPVAAADVAGVTWATGGIIRSLIAAHAAASVTDFSYIGTKRYVSLLADFSGTHASGTPIAATAVRGFPLTAPV